ncbi:MAG: HAMP domain-containing sensor histidine kinase, partial [Clostridium sp.]
KISKKFIGRNIVINGKSLSEEPKSLIYSEDLYVTDPLSLFSGEGAMIVRNVVRNKHGEIWGYVNCIITEKKLKNLISSNLNYNYKLSSVDNSKRLIQNREFLPENEILVEVDFPQTEWILSIDSSSAANGVGYFCIIRLAVLIISIKVYIITFLLMKYPIILKQQVKQINRTWNIAKENEEKYKRIFNFSPDYIFLINPKNKQIIESNNAYQNSINLESIKDIKLTVDDEDLDEFDIVDITIKDKVVRGIEVKVLGTAGETREIEINCILLEQENLPTNILCVGRDLSEKRKVERVEKEKEEKDKLLKEAIEYNNIKTEFFANMSHELRTPLNVILGSLQLVNLNLNKQGDLRTVIESSNKVVKQNCYRLLRIISNIIDITKFEANYLYTEVRKINIVALIEDITISIIDYAKSKDIQIEFDTDIEEVNMYCDPEKIERIILNILSNAIKFTNPKDNIYVNVYDYNENIRISIRDTGIGIPEENINNIFDRFRQVNKSFIREHEGSGIGLSLVKSLVEMHGGVIWATSKIKEGSEFTIEIPKQFLKPDEKDECAVDLLCDVDEDFVEKISIEFSDIYFNK